MKIAWLCVSQSFRNPIVYTGVFNQQANGNPEAPALHFLETPGKESFLWMFFEVRKKASHHPKQKIKADHLSSCHNRCNENSWSSLFIVFMLCSIGGIKTFHIIMWKLLSVYLIFSFFVGISALSARFQSAFCPSDDTPFGI